MFFLDPDLLHLLSDQRYRLLPRKLEVLLLELLSLVVGLFVLGNIFPLRTSHLNLHHLLLTDLFVEFVVVVFILFHFYEWIRFEKDS